MIKELAKAAVRSKMVRLYEDKRKANLLVVGNMPKTYLILGDDNSIKDLCQQFEDLDK
jgi:hypothetical protein